jgi:hypothetical protein
MSKVIKAVAAIGVLVGLAACDSPQPEEVVIIEPAPVVAPQPMGKF